MTSPRRDPAVTRTSLAEIAASGLSDKYELVRELGWGGMGIVWEGRQVALDRGVAIKFMRPDRALDGSIRERFQREARAAALMESEHVPGIIDMDADAECPYLVLELLRGRTLRSILDGESERRLGVERALHLLSQACLGVAHAHGKGVLHRDLKPSNLFVCPREDGSELVKVVDFGIAKLEQTAGAADMTGPGLLGTIGYTAPEQVRDAGAADARSDVYSLGVVLYEALSGQLPHPGAESHEVMQHLLHEEPVPLSRQCPELHPNLCAIVHRAIATRREDRFPSATELRDELLRHAATSSQPSDSDPPRRHPRGLARTVPLLFVGAALLGVGMVIQEARGREAPAPPDPSSPTRTATDSPRELSESALAPSLVEPASPALATDGEPVSSAQPTGVHPASLSAPRQERGPAPEPTQASERGLDDSEKLPSVRDSPDSESPAPEPSLTTPPKLGYDLANPYREKATRSHVSNDPAATTRQAPSRASEPLGDPVSTDSRHD